MGLRVKLYQLGSRTTVFIPRWTAHPCILYQECATRGAVHCCNRMNRILNFWCSCIEATKRLPVEIVNFSSVETLYAGLNGYTASLWCLSPLPYFFTPPFSHELASPQPSCNPMDEPSTILIPLLPSVAFTALYTYKWDSIGMH